MHEEQNVTINRSICPPCFVCGQNARLRYIKGSAQYWDCKGCGLLYQNPLPDPRDMQRFAESEYSVGGYQEYVRARDLKYATFRSRIPLIQQHMLRGRLLDVGCACGYFIDVALQAGYDAYGIEFSSIAISQASPEARPRIFQGNIDQIPADTLGQFDIISAFDIVEHSLSPRQFLLKLCTLLRPGGCLVLTTSDVRHVLRFLMGARWPVLQPFQHTFLFSRHSLRLALEQVGLQVAVLQKATKCLTMDYLVGQIEDLNPSVHRVYQALSFLIPQAIRQRPFQVNIGEMWATATRPE